jgi:peptide/nickel transport system substrate-binding protein
VTSREGRPVGLGRGLALPLLVATLTALAGCSGSAGGETRTVGPDGAFVATPTDDTAVVAGPKLINVCVLGEPDSLYLYGGSGIDATRHVIEALYDGPVDYVDYSMQPVILEAVPSLAAGDVITRAFRADPGDVVVDTYGQVRELAAGVVVRPAGCYSDECAIPFYGGWVMMERMEATFTIKEGVAWSDGEPVTAEDSVFAYQVALDPATPVGRYVAERTAGYTAVGQRRVEWMGVRGYFTSTVATSFFPPLPKHQLGGYTPEELLRIEETRRNPLTWGPYIVDGWVPGEYLALSPSDYYFRSAEGLPYLDQLVFKFADDGAEVAARVLAGECDLGVGVEYDEWQPFLPLLIEAEARGMVRLAAASTDLWEHIDFGILPASYYPEPAFFGDAGIRRAIVQCIDRQAIVDEATYGLGTISHSLLPAEHPLYPGNRIVEWEYSPEAGNARLEEAGWIDADEDGIREAHSVAGVFFGAPLRVTLLAAAEDQIAQRVVDIVRVNLADCGVEVDVEMLQPDELLAPGPDGPVFGRQFDVVEMSSRLDSDAICAPYLSSEVPWGFDWVGRNPSGYSSEGYDAACEAALQAPPGSEEHRQYHELAQVIFSQELPAIPLFWRPRIALARPNVMGFEINGTAPSDLWSVETLYVE